MKNIEKIVTRLLRRVEKDVYEMTYHKVRLDFGKIMSIEANGKYRYGFCVEYRASYQRVKGDWLQDNRPYKYYTDLYKDKIRMYLGESVFLFFEESETNVYYG